MTELSMPGFKPGDRITDRDDRSLTGTFAGVRLDRDPFGVDAPVADIVWDAGVEGPEYLFYSRLRHILPVQQPTRGEIVVTDAEGKPKYAIETFPDDPYREPIGTPLTEEAVQKILNTYPTAEDIMEAMEQDAGLHEGRYWVRRRGTYLDSVMVEADSPKAAMELAPQIPEHVWEASRILTEDRPRRKTPYYLGGVSMSDTRQPWRPEDPAVLAERRERAQKTVQERRERNNTAATTQTEGYSDVEIAARVLSTINYPYFDLDDTDDEGKPFWRRLIPQAQLFIDAGFVRRETLGDDNG